MEEQKNSIKNYQSLDFPGGAVVENSPANAGTPAQSLIWEDPTCHRATKPVGLLSLCSEACAPQLLKPTRRACAPREKPLQWAAHTLQLE